MKSLKPSYLSLLFCYFNVYGVSRKMHEIIKYHSLNFGIVRSMLKHVLSSFVHDVCKVAVDLEDDR